MPKDRLIVWTKLLLGEERNGEEFPWETGALGSMDQINLPSEQAALLSDSEIIQFSWTMNMERPLASP